ncbi:hypothetical protein RGD00_23110, partial [Xinfangfangia sp. LG-4]
MAEDGIGQHLGKGAVSGICAVQQQPGPGGGMIDPFVAPLQDQIEIRIVFAEIMEPPRHFRHGRKSQRRGAHCGQSCGLFQMLRQGLPVAAVVFPARMGVILRCHCRSCHGKESLKNLCVSARSDRILRDATRSPAD